MNKVQYVRIFHTAKWGEYANGRVVVWTTRTWGTEAGHKLVHILCER